MMIRLNDNPRTRGTLKLFSLGIVPMYTLLFACKGDLITSNLSQVGNLPGRHMRFVLWGVLCGAVFYLLFTRLFAATDYRRFAGRAVLVCACSSFLLCVILPFKPDRYPVAAKWHNDLAMLAAVLTAAISLIMSLHLRRVDMRLCCLATLSWIGNVALCIYLLLKTGISGLVETVFIGLSCYHAQLILSQVERDATPQQASQIPEAAAPSISRQES